MWTSWILSMNLATFDPHRHSNSRQNGFLAARSDLCELKDWEGFFLQHVELNWRFNVMTMNEVTFHWPNVSSGFSVIFCFCRLKALRVSFKIFPEIFAPYGGSRLRVSSGIRGLFLTILLFHLLLGKPKMFIPLWRRCFFCIDSPRMDFWRATQMSPFQILPHTKHIQGMSQVGLSYQTDGALSNFGFFIFLFLFFSILSAFPNFGPYLRLYMIWSRSRFDFCQSPPGPHISLGRDFFQ